MIDRIGNCRILSEIGSGGMAVVYKATQESLNRTVAIKALKATAAAEASFAVRFEREALSVATLQHENIVQVYDFQRHDDNAYIVMEFVEGIDLFDLLDKTPVLAVDVAAIIAMQIARALDHAHYRGIIHRDIKPANVMVAKNGAVKLMDFGIARDQSFDDLTKDGTGLGTPSYMSPEQILGEKLDFRSDIFSLGIVLYQMVCRRKPFVEDEQRSVMHKIRLDKPPAPHRQNPHVPRELERIIYRCLEKRREDRYRSTQDLVIALERFLAPRCPMNYRARVVLYLLEQGLVTSEEADSHLHPAVVGGYEHVEAEAPLFRRLLAFEGIVLGLMAAFVAMIHLLPLGGARPALAAAPPPPPVVAVAPPLSGFVRVIVNPWADIFVDGRRVGTTPLAKPLQLAEGRHRLELKNPSFPTDTREIFVAHGNNPPLRVDLKLKP